MERLNRHSVQTQTDGNEVDQKVLTEDIFTRMEVPGDGSCLFWAVTMAYLLPVRCKAGGFNEKYCKIFGVRHMTKLYHVSKLFKTYYIPSFMYKDSVLIKLVSKVFRERVVDEMMEQKEELFRSVSLDDFIHMKHETFVTDGTFLEHLQSAFPAQTQSLDLSKLKPDKLCKSSIAAMDEELDKMLIDFEEMEKFKFDLYLKAMRNSNCWAGQLEIKAIEKLLQCNINVFNSRNNNNNFSRCLNENIPAIYLFNDNNVHFEFGLVQPRKIIMEIFKNLNYDVAVELVKLGVAQVNYQDEIGWTLLHHAVTTDNHKDIIKHLLGQGADLNLKNEDNKTPLDLANSLRQTKASFKLIIAVLVASLDPSIPPQPKIVHNAVVDKEFNLSYGESLKYKRKTLMSEIISLLKQCQKEGSESFNHREPIKSNQKSYLNMMKDAVRNNELDILRNFIKNGNLNVRKGCSLHYAVQIGSLQLAKIYVEDGEANVNCDTVKDLTPLHKAVKLGHFHLVRYFLESGALLTGLSEEIKQNIYRRFIIDNVNKDYQVHGAISLGNVELLKKLLESLSIQNETLFKVYHEIKLHNVQLSSEICIFIENKLMDNCFYSHIKINGKLPNSQFNVDFVKKRIKLVISCIEQLLDYHENEVNVVFVFIGKFIAKNLQVLKQVRILKQVLPWEEMQFCLMVFLLSYTEPLKTDISVSLLLYKKKILNYLSIFKSELLKVDLDDLLNKTRPIKREEIKGDNIVSSVPEFKNLFQDSERLKGVYSLTKIECCLKSVQSVNLNKNFEIGKLVIERALQVSGECLKTSVDSPNLSENLHQMLSDIVPVNATKSAMWWRDALSHMAARYQTPVGNNVEVFKAIQKDLKTFRLGIRYLLFSQKYQILKLFFKKISQCHTYDEFSDMISGMENRREVFMVPLADDMHDIRSPFLQKLASVIDELQKEKPTEAKEANFLKELIASWKQYIEINEIESREIQEMHSHVIKNISAIINFLKNTKNINDVKKEAKRILLWLPHDPIGPLSLSQALGVLALPIEGTCFYEKFNISTKIKVNAFDFFKIKELDRSKWIICGKENNKTHYLDILKKIDKQFLNFFNKKQDANLKDEINNKYQQEREIYVAKHRLIEYYQPNPSSTISWNEFQNLLIKINYFSKKMIASSLFGEKELPKRENIIQRIKQSTTDNNFENYGAYFLFFENFHVLEDIVGFKKKSDSELLNLLQLSHNLRLATEMLVFNLLEILRNDLLFAPNTLFLDEAIPVLIGKNLRNYLAHGDLLIDLHSVDYLKSIIYHIRAIEKNSSEIELKIYKVDKKVGKETNFDIDKLEKQFNETVQVLRNQEQLIEAVNENNISSVRSLMVSGLECKYKDINNWTLYYFAAGTENTEFFTMLYNKSYLNIYYQDKFNHSLIYYLVKNDNIKILKLLIDNYNLNPNVIISEGKSLFYLSTKFKHMKFMVWLLSQGVNKFEIDRDCNSEIMHTFDNDTNFSAVMHCYAKFIKSYEKKTNPALAQDGNERGNNDLVKYWMSKFLQRICQAQNFLPNEKEKEEQDMIMTLSYNADYQKVFESISKFFTIYKKTAKIPLYNAMVVGDLSSVKIIILIINYVTGMFAKDNSGFVNPMLEAVEHGQDKIMTCLLNNKANINYRTDEVDDILNSAVQLIDNPNLVEMLIDIGANINTKINNSLSPLHLASYNGNYKVVEALLRKGSDVNCLTVEGVSALFFAAVANSSKTVKVLLNNGANVYAKFPLGQTILHLTSSMGFNKIADILLEHGALINCLDKYCNTPLHAAIISNKTHAAMFLINHGADVNLSNVEGLTPLHMASQTGNFDILKLLIDRNPKYEKDKKGFTPLSHGAGLGHVEIVKILLKKYHNSYNAAVDDEKNIYMTPLHSAAMTGNNEILDELLNHNFNIDVTDPKCIETPLHCAVMEGHYVTVKKLLDRQARTDIGNSFRDTALHCAASKGHTKIIKLLLLRSNKKTLEFENNGGATALHLAALKGHLDSVKVLLENGANINAKTHDESTPLHLAAESGNCQLVKLLLDNGAHIDAETKNHRTSLHCSINKNHLNIFQFLLEKGARVNELESIPYLSLFIAVNQGRKNIVNILLKNGGVDINATFKGLSCLHVAAQHGHVIIAEILLRNGANIEVVNQNNTTPLHRAAIYCQNEVIKLLHKHKANLNAKQDRGYTPLHLAAMLDHAKYSKSPQGHVIVAEILLKLGANAEAVDQYSRTPLHYAAFRGKNEFIKLLHEYNANLNAKDIRDYTPLHFAAMQGHDECISSLLKFGADVCAVTTDSLTALQLATKYQKYNSAITILNHQSDSDQIDVQFSRLENALDLLTTVLKAIPVDNKNINT